MFLFPLPHTSCNINSFFHYIGSFLGLRIVTPHWSILITFGMSHFIYIPKLSSYYFTLLCFVDCASLYNLVNRTNLVYNFSLKCLLIFSTCFGQLFAHHQEKLRHLCDTWYLSLYMGDCLVCRAEWISFRPAYRAVIYIERQIKGVP